MRGLRSLGVSHSAYGALLTPLLIKKLPQELRVLISRKMTGKEWEFNSIIEALLEEIEACEGAGVTSRGLNPPIKNKREFLSATTLTTKGNIHPECCYCGENHEPSLYKNVLEVESYRQVLKSRGCCFNCLRKGHRV